MAAMTIGRLAQRAGVAIDTVRFYERSGLLPTPARTTSGYRYYKEDDLHRLHFIRRAKAVGFTLDEIAELLRLGGTGGSRAEVRHLADQRIGDIDRRIRELTAVRDVLSAYAQQCVGDGPASGCPILQSLQALEAK